MINEEFHSTQGNFFTLEELIENHKLIPQMLSLDEDKMMTLIQKADQFTSVERELLKDFLAYLLLKVKILNENFDISVDSSN